MILNDRGGNSELTFGVGIDIENVARFAGSLSRNVLDALFTSQEIKYCVSKKNPAEHFAARYAGKEAVIKALSDLHANRSFSPKDYRKIEILNDRKSVPKISIAALNIHGVSVKVSLTHTKDIAGAIAVAIKQ